MLIIFPSICSANQDTYVPGQLIVKFSQHINISSTADGFVKFNIPALDELSRRYKIYECSRIFKSVELSNIYLLNLMDTADIDELSQRFTENSYVVYSSPNYYAGIRSDLGTHTEHKDYIEVESKETATVTPATTETPTFTPQPTETPTSTSTPTMTPTPTMGPNIMPDDVLFSDQWGLHNTGQTGGSFDSDIDGPESWFLETGDPSVIIAILDTGIDLDHPDLASKVVTGYDFVNDDLNAQDDNGHGTHVAGIAGADSDNGVGITGVCWECRLMPVKVLGANGIGVFSDIAAGVEFAADNGAIIINMSFGSETFSPLLQDAVDYAHDSGCLLIGASGNVNSDEPFYPAAMNNVLSVAALDHNDVKYQLSGYGEWVDICAPGVNIMSTVYNDTYSSWSGTSMAAPFVAGVAGLLFSANPSWNHNLVEAQMIRFAVNIDGINPGYETLLGSGRVNGYACLSVSPEPEIAYSSFQVNDPAPGDDDGVLDNDERVDLIISLFSSWGNATGISATLSTTDPYIIIYDDTSVYGDAGSQETINNASNPFDIHLDVDCPSGHVVTFDLVVQDSTMQTWNLQFDLVTGSREYAISGIFSTNTTWLANETYNVTGPTMFNSGATLIIEPGVTISLDEGAYITITDGASISAVGTEMNRILFTSSSEDPAPGAWGYIFVEGTANDAVYDIDGNYISGPSIQYATFEYGTYNLLIEDCSIYIALNTFQYGMGHSGSLPPPGSFTYGAGGFSCFEGAPVIELNNFSNNGHGNWGGVMLHNTAGVRFQWNTVENNLGSGIGIIEDGSGNSLVEYNRILNNHTNEYLQYGAGIWTESCFSGGTVTINRNLIAGNRIDCDISPDIHYRGAGVCFLNENEDVSFTENTIVDNYMFVESKNDQRAGTAVGAGICFDSFSYIGAFTFDSNNIFRNEIFEYTSNTEAGLKEMSSDVTLSNTWWGTTDTNAIDNAIWDVYDDFALGEIIYTPFASEFIEDAPPVLLDITLDPPSPVGAQLVTFTLSFKTMDPAFEPTVTFGLEEPYDAHIINGSWQPGNTIWEGSFEIDYFTGDGTNTISVSGARDLHGMEMPLDTNHPFIIETGISGVSGLAATARPGAIDITWQPNYEPDLAGYYLYYDTDSGIPYNGSGSAEGDSPIDVGNVNAFSLTGLVDGQRYYISIRAYDDNSNLGDYSPEVWANFIEEPVIPTTRHAGLVILLVSITLILLKFSHKKKLS